MGVEIRLPNITGATEKEQLLQLKSYLYQLSEQLQWAFDNINTTGGTGSYVENQVQRVVIASPGSSSGNTGPSFNELKSLIIKSAEIIDAYYEEINKRLVGLYVAESDFGAFKQWTEQNIEANSQGITQTFENVQTIITKTKEDIEGELNTIGQDLSYAQNDVIVLKCNVEGLGSDIASVEADIGELDTTLQNTKVELSGNIDAAKTELGGTIESTKTELSESISNTVEEAKTELNSSIDTARSELSGEINSATNAVNANVEAAKEEASAGIDSAKSELDGKIGETASELDGKIAETNGRIDETDGKISSLGDGIDAANNRIDGVDKAIQDTKENITTEIQRVTNSVSEVDKLRLAAENALRGSIDDLELVLTDLKEIVVGVTAYVKSGLIYTTDAGVPVYGIEIGQQVEANGTQVFNKFARFTSEKLSFYDANGNEVAYISDKKLYIGQAQITISLKVGGLVDYVLANGDVVTKWEGG